jgi:hypothetical protein
MDGIAQDAVAEERFERPAIHDIAGAIEDLIDVELQPGVFEDAYGVIPIKFYEHVDIAIRAYFPACDRTEYGGMEYP